MSRRGCGRSVCAPGWPLLSLPCFPFSLEAVQLGPCSGLLVDWLEMLDPEVISSCPELQQRLLFSRGKVGCAPRRGRRTSTTLGVVGAGLPRQPLPGQSLCVGSSKSLGLTLAGLDGCPVPSDQSLQQPDLAARAGGEEEDQSFVAQGLLPGWETPYCVEWRVEPSTPSEMGPLTLWGLLGVSETSPISLLCP